MTRRSKSNIRSIKKVEYIFTDDGGSYDVVESGVKMIQGARLKITSEKRYRSRDSIYSWSRNFQIIGSLIEELSKNTKFLIPAFLLRAQLVEFALKHLLLHTPYKPVKGLGKKPIEEMTMGEVITGLEKCNDQHLDRTVRAAKRFKALRNEITHNLINSEKTREEMERDIIEKIGIAEDIENQVIFFAEYVEETLGVKFEQI